jgi:hypothetical protein
MKSKNIFPVFFLAFLIALPVFSLSACGTTTTMTATTTTTSTTTITSPGGGGAVVNSDSIITGQIQAIRSQAAGYPWEVDVLVLSSENVDDLPNPTSDKLGQVIAAKTDEDLKGFQAGQQISARVKYVGDVPLPGISLYIYDIALK